MRITSTWGWSEHWQNWWHNVQTCFLWKLICVSSGGFLSVRNVLWGNLWCMFASSKVLSTHEYWVPSTHGYEELSTGYWILMSTGCRVLGTEYWVKSSQYYTIYSVIRYWYEYSVLKSYLYLKFPIYLLHTPEIHLRFHRWTHEEDRLLKLYQHLI